MKIAVRQPPWGRFYRSCELVVGCPSVHWGLTRAPQRGSVVLMIFRLLSPTSAKVLISRCLRVIVLEYLPLTVKEAPSLNLVRSIGNLILDIAVLAAAVPKDQVL